MRDDDRRFVTALLFREYITKNKQQDTSQITLQNMIYAQPGCFYLQYKSGGWRVHSGFHRIGALQCCECACGFSVFSVAQISPRLQ